MNRKVPFAEGEYYHVYNRGVEKRIIFSDDIDYGRFVLLLKVANTTDNIVIRDLIGSKTYEEVMAMKFDNPIVGIGAYCLMPNHFHILITPLKKNGIEKFRHKVHKSWLFKPHFCSLEQ